MMMMMMMMPSNCHDDWLLILNKWIHHFQPLPVTISLHQKV